MLRRYDLKDTVLPKVSIDEFEPKTGTVEEVIVVSFYCIDESPANDLAAYLDKSFINILDTDASPNPDENMHFLTFVELERTPNFFGDLESILQEVENLTGRLKWKVKPYLASNEYDFESGAWHSFVVTDKERYVSKEYFINHIKTEVAKNEFNARKFFSNDNSIKIRESQNDIYLDTRTDSIYLKKKFYGTEDELASTIVMPYLFESNYDVTRLKNMLGVDWLVEQYGNGVVISSPNSSKVLYALFS
jgi:hypothetical protein